MSQENFKGFSKISETNRGKVWPLREMVPSPHGIRKYATGDWCSNLYFMECGHWIACPTDTHGNNPDCTKVPYVVSNSWGDDSFDYDDIIEAWHAAGFVPLFSSAKSGPSCSFTGYPGDSSRAIGVGSTTSANELSYFSSVGPSSAGLLKPDVSAPGSNVFSASYTSDTGYATMSWTSMACPHAAGATALLFAQKDDLTYEEVKNLLQNGAVPIESTGRNCGGIDESIYPNHHAGYGRIDAKNSAAILTNTISIALICVHVYKVFEFAPLK